MTSEHEENSEPQGVSEQSPASVPETAVAAEAPASPFGSVLFQAPDLDELKAAALAKKEQEKQEREAAEDESEDDGEVVSKKRRRRRRGDTDLELVDEDEDPNTVTKVRTPRVSESTSVDQVTSLRGSTRLEAKKQRRQASRAGGRRRQAITEAEFLARRESVDRKMIVRQKDERIQIGVLEDGVLAEHFVSQTQQDSLIGNVYLGKVQNVLPSMEAAFVDIGRGRNAVLYAGEVNWDAAGLDGAPRKIERALKSGDSVLVQVTKDPVGHKGSRLTSQISLPGRFLVYVPGASMTGISRKLPDNERARLKKILKDQIPEGAGVIVRTAAEGASEEELTHDINRLRAQWEEIEKQAASRKVLAPELLYQEPDLSIKTVRDVFNEDFSAMVVQGEEVWDAIEAYVTYMAPDLVDRLQKWEEEQDAFDHFRIDEQLAKALNRKVYLPSGGSLVIDRTEAMTVVDVNTGKFTGSGGNLEETVTKNNLEAAEEIVRQLRLRDIGGIIVVDFIDMVLESNRDLVLRRLVECLGRDRTKHQVAEVTSLGLVQMTRKRMGTGLLEVFSEPCATCDGYGVVVHDEPLKSHGALQDDGGGHHRNDRKRNRNQQRHQEPSRDHQDDPKAEATRHAFASIAAASKHQEDAEEAPEAGHGNTVSEEAGESKSAKKRKRRKRNKNRDQHGAPQQEETQEQRSGAQHSEDAATTEDPDMVVTIHGEVVSLPHGKGQDKAQDSSEEKDGSSRQGRSRRGGKKSEAQERENQSLDSLEQAFDEAAPVASEDEDDSFRAPRGREARGRRAAQSGRAGREAAEAARRAALEALEDMRPGRRSRSKSKDAGKDSQGGRGRREEASSAEENRGSARRSEEGTRRREDSASRGRSEGQRSEGQRSGGSRRRDGEPAARRRVREEQESRPLVSGVANPGAARAQAEQDEAGQTATEQAPARAAAQAAPSAAAQAPAPRKRRSRRASSGGGSGAEVTSGRSGEARGGQVVSEAPAAGPQTAQQAPVEEVPMLGVGVKASEIKRPS